MVHSDSNFWRTTSLESEEQNNLIHDPIFHKMKQHMQNQLYTMMEELGGMEIPLNRPKGQRKTERLRSQGGEKAADFPEAFFVDEALRKELQE